MANGRARMVVEESPLGTLARQLPSTILGMMQLNNQMESKRLDKEWQESQLYLRDLISSKNTLKEATMKAYQSALDKGLALDVSLNEILSKSSEHATSGGEKAGKDFKQMLQFEVDGYANILDGITGEISLFNRGKDMAMDVDINASSTLDADELIKIQESLNMMDADGNLAEVPMSLKQGIKNTLNTPAARKENKERRKVLTALSIFESKDIDPNTPGIQIDQNAPGGPELLQALEAFNLDERSPQVANNLIKASSKHLEIKPFEISGEIWSPIGIGQELTPQGQQDIVNNSIRQHPDGKYTGVWFRVEDKPGTNIADKAVNATTKEFDINFRNDFKRLKASAKSLFPTTTSTMRGKKQKRMQFNLAEAPEPVAGSLNPTSLPEHKESFAKNLAMLFSGKYDPGSGTSIATVKKEWIKRAFKANDGWKDPVAVADAILLDPRFQELLNDPQAWKDAFNFTGKGQSEVAFDRFFKEQSALYNRLLDYEYFLDQAEASGATTQLNLGTKVNK